MGYNIGFFKATDTGYTGKIQTLVHNFQVEFHRVIDPTTSSSRPQALAYSRHICRFSGLATTTTPPIAAFFACPQICSKSVMNFPFPQRARCHPACGAPGIFVWLIWRAASSAPSA